MPHYQNSTVEKSKLIIGNYKIEIATYGTSIGGTFTNLGAGIINSFGHEIEKYDVQAGNAPDPIEGISDETFPVEGELIEYVATSMSLVYPGIYTATATSSADGTILYMGGNTNMTDIAVRLTNVTLYTATGGSAISSETIVYLPKATLDVGMSFTAKSDNDTDPINVMGFAVTGKLDATLTAGQQLAIIQKKVRDAD